MQRLCIKHVTEYIFPTTLTLNTHRLLLRPREGHDVRIETSMLEITSANTIKWQRDVFNNSLAVVNFLEPSNRLLIASEVIIQNYELTAYDFTIEDHPVNYPFIYPLDEQVDLAAFQQPIFLNDEYQVNIWLQQLMLYGMDTSSMLLKLNQSINQQFRYQMREEAGVQSPFTTLKQASGSCRDYATFFIEACRWLGFASRFVSGYLHAPATEAGNATTHAWVEVYLLGTG